MWAREFLLCNSGLVNSHLDVTQMLIGIGELYLHLLSSVKNVIVSQLQEIKQEYLTVMLLIIFNFNYDC